MPQTNSFRYRVVDVFTTESLAGNPLAVFPDSSAIDETTMQKIARELNLAETVFVLPATRKDCQARVRIFTPAKEMAFAGHPTLGTAFVLLQEKIVARNVSEFLLEEQVGPVPLRIEEGQRPLIWLRMPPIHEGKCYESSLCARVLGLEPQDLFPMKPQLFSAGNPTVVVAAKDKATVDRAWLDLAGMKTLRGAEERALLRLPVYAYARWGLFANVCTGVRNSGRSGVRKLHGAIGSSHDASQPDLELCRHPLRKRTRNKNGPPQFVACRASRKASCRWNLRRRSRHADCRGVMTLGPR
jgi:predicted PhzF superfamily epimerase YddE/YHI9